jgi:3-methylcrotonyl-CoA carboxylase alpha subunit
MMEDGSIRIDTGIREGDRITTYYDPMIAKVIVHGANR